MAAATSMLEVVSTELPWDLVLTYARMPRWKPEDVARGAREIVARLEAHRIPVTVHEPSLYLSIPYTAEVRSLAGTFRAKPSAYSADRRDGLEADLVYVPARISNSISNLFDKNQDTALSSAERLRGRIVISEGFSFPGKVLEFEQKGALGVIAVNPGANAHWGICTSIWGTPDLDDLPRKPGIPVCAVNNPDGRKLIEVAEAGGRATIRTEMEEGWYRQPIPVVEIRGRDEPEKFVLLHGHYDSWDVGVGDNATGDATLLEIARVLWAHRDQLRRSVRIAWWPGHSTGRYAGSTWFADRFALDLDENCVAQVNCDSPGCRWASVFKDVSWMSETEAYCQDVIREVTGLDSHGERPHRAGDYAFNNIGLSSFFMLSSTMPDELRAEKGYYAVGGCGGNIAWHTEDDQLEIADRDHLLRDIKVYLAAVVGVANADILPFDWRTTMAEFRQTLEGYRKAAGARFDFAPSEAAISDLDRALAAFYDAAKQGRIAPAAANAVIMRLARILVPVNFTREARFRHDPALPVPPLPSLALAKELDGFDERTLGFALTQLTRGQNRLVAALREAKRLVEGAFA
ncbi:MAG TPA: M28 family peptidase [Geminicoccaceae bacterium]|nr:M28 family peptidase [Geminicoccaceae bacterium]